MQDGLISGDFLLCHPPPTIEIHFDQAQPDSDSVIIVIRVLQLLGVPPSKL